MKTTHSMRRITFLLVALFTAAIASAQPEPYPIDRSFKAPLDFIQKCWSGEYKGLDPGSRQLLTIRRTLTLNADMTFTNLTEGYVGVEGDDFTVFRLEAGTYAYAGKGVVSYDVERDSVLDIMAFLGERHELNYVVKTREAGEAENYVEDAQFTYPANDGTRQWVLFDTQLMSPQDPSRASVYVLSANGSSVSAITTDRNDPSVRTYDLLGRSVGHGIVPQRGVIIRQGRKQVTY